MIFNFSFVQLFPIILIYAITLPPMWIMLARTGLSKWWLLFFLVPVWGHFILAWIIALRAWPTQTKPAEVFQ